MSPLGLPRTGSAGFCSSTLRNSAGIGFGCSVWASSGKGASASPATAPAVPIIILRVGPGRSVIMLSLSGGRVAGPGRKGKCGP